MVSEKLCFNILIGFLLGWKVKGQPWPQELIYTHSLIRLNISSENNDLGFNLSIVFKKINFRKQIWHWRWVGQGQSRIIIWTNLVGLLSPLLHTESQGHRPSGSGEVSQAEHSKILSTFIKLLLPLRYLICLILSGRFTQALLYMKMSSVHSRLEMLSCMYACAELENYVRGGQKSKWVW